MPSRELPNLLIIGVIRGGTTSLFQYLSAHPNVCGSSKKETAFFVPGMCGEPVGELHAYKAFFRHCGTSPYKYLMEATPIYVYGGEKLAKTILDFLGPVKIIIMLREPKARLLSHYKHSRAMKRYLSVLGDISWDEFAARGLAELEKKDHSGSLINVYTENIFLSSLTCSLYSHYVSSWFSLFPCMVKVLFTEHLALDPEQTMQEICTWLNIDPDFYQHFEFSVENPNVLPRFATLHQIAEHVNTHMEPTLRRHHAIKKFIRRAYFSLNKVRDSTREDYLKPITEHKLQCLFRAHNLELIEILTSQGYRDFPSWLRDLQENQRP